MQTRRQFILNCSLTAAAAALAPAALAQTSAPAGTPGFAQFADAINSRFTLHFAGRSLSLVLAKAELMPSGKTQAGFAGEHFSLLFRGPAHTPLTQDTYTFVHPHLGALPIFIVPAGRSDATEYTAIFHRPVATADWTALLEQAPKRIQKC